MMQLYTTSIWDGAKFEFAELGESLVMIWNMGYCWRPSTALMAILTQKKVGKKNEK